VHFQIKLVPLRRGVLGDELLRHGEQRGGHLGGGLYKFNAVDPELESAWTQPRNTSNVCLCEMTKLARRREMKEGCEKTGFKVCFPKVQLVPLHLGVGAGLDVVPKTHPPAAALGAVRAE
jgi:hypothetical protein